MSNPADVANESLESVSEIKRKLYKKQKRSRMRPNIASIPSQLNAPLTLISLPDDLTSKLNFISSDTAASSRLFTSVLTTKQSSLRLSSGERFIETGVPVSVEVRITHAMLHTTYFNHSYSPCTVVFCVQRNKILNLKFKFSICDISKCTLTSYSI